MRLWLALILLSTLCAIVLAKRADEEPRSDNRGEVGKRDEGG
ncbi:uncharacterized protein DEA37_0005762, partial [Paragonimus westermani]